MIEYYKFIALLVFYNIYIAHNSIEGDINHIAVIQM